jgi:CIC family chloride channel protein
MIRRISTLALLGLVVGGVVGVLAVGFVEAVLWVNDLFHVSGNRASLDPTWRTMLTLGIPAAGGLIVGVIATTMPGSRFHGPQDAIRSAQSLDASMPVKNAFLSTIAAGLSLGSGASVGQYGPLAHMGAWIGSWVARVTNDRSLGSIGIACGAAAAISAAFHAPLAGLVFSREVLLRQYSLRAFAPIAVASTLGYVIAHSVFRREPLFRIDDFSIASPYEYLAFVGIGITGALVATAFMRAIDVAGALSRRLAVPVPLRTALAGLALGVVALQVPEILGIGQQTLQLALAGNVLSAADLATILVAKLLVTALCLGFGFAGGVFSPALLIGTLFGALAGAGIAAIFADQQSQIAVYAVCGMVAVASPVIGAPLTGVLIVFELTQNFDLATAAIISVAFANLIGFRIYGRSFFDVQLEARGFDLSLGRDKVTAEQHGIRDLLEQDYTHGNVDDALVDIRDALIRDKRSEAYISDHDGNYVGTLSLQHLMAKFADGTALDDGVGRHAEREGLELNVGTSVWQAMSRMEDFVGESIPVLEDGRLVGVLFESTIVAAYLRILDGIRREEHAAT